MCKFCGCFRFGKPDKETIKVDGMSCGHCKNAVEKAVRALPGVLVAVVDLEAGTLQVEYDHHKSKRDEVVAAIVEAGYQVH